MTKLQWIIVGGIATIGIIGAYIWKKNDDKKVNEEKEGIMKSIKAEFTKKKK